MSITQGWIQDSDKMTTIVLRRTLSSVKSSFSVIMQYVVALKEVLTIAKVVLEAGRHVDRVIVCDDGPLI